MNFLRRLLTRNQDLCPTHTLQFSHICSHKSCSQHRFLCPKCIQIHPPHDFASILQYKNKLSRFQAELVYKERVKGVLDAYLEGVVKHVQKICQEQRASFLERMMKMYYPKEFAVAEEKYSRGEDIMGELFSMRMVVMKELWEEQIGKIQDLQKKIKDNITSQSLRVSASDLQLKRTTLSPLPKTSKVDQILQLLPFPCRLNLRFQASSNSFITKNIYTLNIQPPIVVLITSAKAKTFGGYSPNMFTPTGEYIEDKKGESFLFSLDEGEIMPIKMELRRFAIKGGVNWGFGRGDLVVSEECQKGGISWADVGHVYRKPVKFGEDGGWLAGSWYFRVLEYQIYEVVKNGKQEI